MNDWICHICDLLGAYAKAQRWGTCTSVSLEDVKTKFFYYWAEGKGCDDDFDCVIARNKPSSTAVTPSIDTTTCSLSVSDIVINPACSTITISDA